jgi:cytochrome b
MICTTGVMMTSDAFWGVEWVGHLHEAAVNTTLAFVVLHLGGVVFSSLKHRENLVAAMITGRKRAPDA